MGSGVTAAPPPSPAPASPEPGTNGGRREALRPYLTAGAFLAPAALLLAVWVVYPTIRTAIRSLFDRAGDRFVGLENYSEIFTNDVLLTAVRNSAIWVGVVPALVTALGLVFAVLTERVSWATAFKLVIFMPIAISLFAAGVIWRLVLEINPEQGAANAAIAAVYDGVRPPGPLTGAQGSGPDVASAGRAIVVSGRVPVGGTALVGLTGIRAAEVPESALQAVEPAALADGIAGVVWRDFSPGGGMAGVVEPGELGLPNVTVEAQGPGGTETVTTRADGSFVFEGIPPGEYRIGIGADTFRESFGGVAWLGSTLITMSVIIAYIWVWAGFAMVVIAAGLAALPRDLQEAARTDGANEWQVFRRITVPLLAPVLTVVFITMVINVLKVFDIVLAVAPGAVQDDANVIALAMWRVAFTGQSNFGLGSAIATFLFLLVIPILLLNIRRFRREQT